MEIAKVSLISIRELHIAAITSTAVDAKPRITPVELGNPVI